MANIKWNSAELIARAQRGAMIGVTRGIGIVEKRAVELVLQTKKSGRKYRRRGIIHQASAPGEPFASDTGTTLAAREIVTFSRVSDRNLIARLIFRGWNAFRLEHGTRRMAPRPFARRALAETRDQVQDAVYAEIAAELRTGGRR